MQRGLDKEQTLGSSGSFLLLCLSEQLLGISVPFAEMPRARGGRGDALGVLSILQQGWESLGVIPSRACSQLHPKMMHPGEGSL